MSSLFRLFCFQLTDEEVREGEELKQKLQKKHKKTAKKVCCPLSPWNVFFFDFAFF